MNIISCSHSRRIDTFQEKKGEQSDETKKDSVYRTLQLDLPFIMSSFPLYDKEDKQTLTPSPFIYTEKTTTSRPVQQFGHTYSFQCVSLFKKNNNYFLHCRIIVKTSKL